MYQHMSSMKTLLDRFMSPTVNDLAGAKHLITEEVKQALPLLGGRKRTLAIGLQLALDNKDQEMISHFKFLIQMNNMKIESVTRK